MSISPNNPHRGRLSTAPSPPGQPLAIEVPKPATLTCSKCRKPKPLWEFVKCSVRGQQRYCRVCILQYQHGRQRLQHERWIRKRQAYEGSPISRLKKHTQGVNEGKGLSNLPSDLKADVLARLSRILPRHPGPLTKQRYGAIVGAAIRWAGSTSQDRKRHCLSMRVKGGTRPRAIRIALERDEREARERDRVKISASPDIDRLEGI